MEKQYGGSRKEKQEGEEGAKNRREKQDGGAGGRSMGDKQEEEA